MLKDFLHTLIEPDFEERREGDRALVAAAANLLEVGEFQFLQLAFRARHDKDLPAVLIDRLFADYMLRDRVPHWAAAHARQVLEWEARGLLAPHDPTFHRYDHSYARATPKGVKAFCLAVLVVVATVGGGLVVGHVTTQGDSTSVLPPYFDRGDLAVPARKPGSAY